jgi:hypothetical protein
VKIIGIGAAIILLALMSCGLGSCLAFDYAFNYNETSGYAADFFIGLGRIGLFCGTVVVVVGIIVGVRAMM